MVPQRPGISNHVLTICRLVQLAELKKAVIVSANYRLLPEATGKDIIEDLTDFYDWVQKSLPTKVSNMSNGSEVDLNNILVAGESAGKFETNRCLAWGHVKA